MYPRVNAPAGLGPRMRMKVSRLPLSPRIARPASVMSCRAPVATPPSSSWVSH